jgi:hypothetical protein
MTRTRKINVDALAALLLSLLLPCAPTLSQVGEGKGSAAAAPAPPSPASSDIGAQTGRV